MKTKTQNITSIMYLFVLSIIAFVFSYLLGAVFAGVAITSFVVANAIEIAVLFNVGYFAGIILVSMMVSYFDPGKSKAFNLAFGWQ
jgi:hypothetical protein